MSKNIVIQDEYSRSVRYNNVTKLTTDLYGGGSCNWIPEDEQYELGTKNITTNGTYAATSDNLDGYSSVTVNVAGAPVLGTKEISTNGTYTASNDSLDGYSSVSVNVTNSYAAGDEGKVVSNGALVAQTAHAEVTSNGTIDTTLNNSVTVNVSGGGGAISRVNLLPKFSASGSKYIGQIYSGSYMQISGNAGYIISQNNKVVQLSTMIPKEATKLYLNMTASGNNGQYNLLTLYLLDAPGVTGQLAGNFSGNIIKAYMLCAYHSSASAINSQDGLTISVSTPYAVPQQVVEVDLSVINIDTYLGFHDCDNSAYFYEIYAE